MNNLLKAKKSTLAHEKLLKRSNERFAMRYEAIRKEENELFIQELKEENPDFTNECPPVIGWGVDDTSRLYDLMKKEFEEAGVSPMENYVIKHGKSYLKLTNEFKAVAKLFGEGLLRFAKNFGMKFQNNSYGTVSVDFSPDKRKRICFYFRSRRKGGYQVWLPWNSLKVGLGHDDLETVFWEVRMYAWGIKKAWEAVD